MALPLDLKGKRFGRLVVLSEEGRDKWGSIRWLCQCDCGKTVITTSANLKKGNTTSCGCAHRDAITKHGMSSTKFYSVYQSMCARCDNPKDKAYPLYGGRGIHYCVKWSRFDGFYEDMFPDYEEGLTLDRIDPNGNYCFENCRWIPVAEQAFSKTRFSTNNSGVSGVHYDKYGRRWKARWHDYPSGKGKQVSFPIAKYGDDAFDMACAYRERMIAEQIAKGAPYTQFHGDPKHES